MMQVFKISQRRPYHGLFLSRLHGATPAVLTVRRVPAHAELVLRPGASLADYLLRSEEAILKAALLHSRGDKTSRRSAKQMELQVGSLMGIAPCRQHHRHLHCCFPTTSALTAKSTHCMLHSGILLSDCPQKQREQPRLRLPIIG